MHLGLSVFTPRQRPDMASVFAKRVDGPGAAGVQSAAFHLLFFWTCPVYSEADFDGSSNKASL
jgi:hypothetical protein